MCLRFQSKKGENNKKNLVVSLHFVSKSDSLLPLLYYVIVTLLCFYLQIPRNNQDCTST